MRTCFCLVLGYRDEFQNIKDTSEHFEKADFILGFVVWKNPILCFEDLGKIELVVESSVPFEQVRKFQWCNKTCFS